MVIRLDVMSFFASVTAGRVYGLLRAAGFPEPVAHVLTGLCTTRTPPDVLRRAPARVPNRDLRLALLRTPHLPQGAPTSPALANLCGFRLDRRLAGLARAYGLGYTRYADDLAFSGHTSQPERLIDIVRSIVTDEGFRLNEAKTRIRGAADRQLLAGLVVNVAPAVPRKEYDALRALRHNARATPAWTNRTARVIPTSWRTSPGASPGSATATRDGPRNCRPFFERALASPAPA